MMISSPPAKRTCWDRKAAMAALRRARLDQSGVSAVEFALIAPIFVAIILGTPQAAVVWFAKTKLQDAVGAAARLVLTGQTQSANYTQANFATAMCSNLPVIFVCNGLMINLAPQAPISRVSTAAPTRTYDSHGNVTNTFGFNSGAAGSVMVLQVLYQFPVIAGPLFAFSTQSNGSLLMVATVVFQNEPQ